MTKIFGVFFRLPFEAKPFGVIETPQGIRSGIHPMMPDNAELIGVNISDYLISLDHGQFPSKIFDINVAKRILFAKPRSDFKQGSEPWAGIMPVADVFLPKNFFPKIRAIEQNRYGSYQEWLQTLPDFWDVSLISAVKIVYEKLRLELEFENLLQTFE